MQFVRFAIPVLLLVTTQPADAASTTCQAVFEVHAAGTDHIWLPGTLRHQSGHYTMTFMVVHKDAKALPPATTIEVDLPGKVASIGSAQGAPTPLNFEQLSKVKFSEIGKTATSLAGFVMVGDRLRTETKFIRNTQYGKEPVQEFTFRESDSVFGQVLYSPVYGLPLRLEVVDEATKKRRIIEVKGVKR